METLAHLNVIYEEQQVAHMHPAMTEEEEAEYHDATTCHLCGQDLLPENTMFHNGSKVPSDNFKVCDHDHFTGAYLGAAHAGCNLQVDTVISASPILRMALASSSRRCT